MGRPQRKHVLASVMTLASTLAAHAEFVPGNVFVETCSNPNPERQAACVGFVAGITDAYLHSGQFCLPPNIQARDISDFVKTYVATTRSIQGQPAANMVLLALKARYPCVAAFAQVPRIPRMEFNFGGFRLR